MKKLLFIAAAFVMSSAAFSQTKAEDFIKFPGLVHDFGKIKQGVPVTYDFQFTNIADKPVVVESASASCGCTTPKWPQAAIMAGKKDMINVGYNAAGVGSFSKTITVKVAGVDSPLTLTITGEVLATDAFDNWTKEEAAKAAAEKTTKSKSKTKNKSGK
jgi:hypothetical protein